MKGSFLPCPCGARMTYAGRRPKTFVTALGEMTLARAYYHCKTCNSGFAPRDRALLMEHASLSPAVAMVPVLRQFVCWIVGSAWRILPRPSAQRRATSSDSVKGQPPPVPRRSGRDRR